MANNGLVAGTIMVTNQQGESFFLLRQQDDKLSFFFEKITEEMRFPMGVIMKSLLEQIEVEPDSLRLVDLSNIKFEDYRASLFVFDLVNRPDNPDDLIKDPEKMVWRRSKDVTHLLEECDFSGVPIYGNVVKEN